MDLSLPSTNAFSSFSDNGVNSDFSTGDDELTNNTVQVNPYLKHFQRKNTEAVLNSSEADQEYYVPYELKEVEDEEDETTVLQLYPLRRCPCLTEEQWLDAIEASYLEEVEGEAQENEQLEIPLEEGNTAPNLEDTSAVEDSTILV